MRAVSNFFFIGSPFHGLFRDLTFTQAKLPVLSLIVKRKTFSVNGSIAYSLEKFVSFSLRRQAFSGIL